MRRCVVRRAWCVGIAFVLACQARAGAGNGAKTTREFNGQTAFTYIEQQMAFGPRVPNTPGHDKMGDWLAAQLRQRADTVIVQTFTPKTSKGVTLRLRNFFARFRPEATDRVLFLAHWDTRPKADKSANLGQQQLPVPGANDGASGVAVLLGVADALKARAPGIGVDLLFVDGEDYGDFNDSTETLLGARYFAAHLPAGYTPLFAVLFDMVGDKDLQFLQEGWCSEYGRSPTSSVTDRCSRREPARPSPTIMCHCSRRVSTRSMSSTSHFRIITRPKTQ